MVLAAALGVSACGGAATPRQTTVMSLSNLDCATCGEDLARAVIQEDGVYKTAFDRRRVELTVVAAPRVSALALALRRRPAKEDFGILPGPGQGSYVAWAKAPEGADVREIAKGGEDVPALAPHLAAGKVTVFDFSATWCEPCRKLDEHVLAIVAARRDVAYRKLDVGDWDTPLGLRYLKGVKELPYVLIFDAKGQRVEAMSGLDLGRFDRALEKATEAR